MKVKKSLLLYCFKADNFYNYDRRVKILAIFLKRKIDKDLIESMLKRNIVTFNDVLSGVIK